MAILQIEEFTLLRYKPCLLNNCINAEVRKYSYICIFREEFLCAEQKWWAKYNL